jgi:translation initiation factor 2 subunit 3
LSQKCPYCGKVFKRLSAHKCPSAPEKDSAAEISPEKPEKKPLEEPKSTKTAVPKPQKPQIKGGNLKEIINKTQAETNIGLVGHVDHGKTTLVKAICGEWTDRFSDEQERGISIKLGYANATILKCPNCDKFMTAWMAEQARKKGEKRYTCTYCKGDLEFVRKISFVDAPGHSVLMSTMLSGSSLMDGALLLIAADEICPQPQTREHLAALEIANVQNIVIVQNKIDSVSEERAIDNYNEIRTFVKGTIAENAPIIPVSAVFNANIGLVIEYFEKIIPTPSLNENEVFRFLIARSFDINKPGTPIEKLRGGVVGGSIIQGIVKVGEEIEIKPGLRVKDIYKPINAKIVSLSQGNVRLEMAKPGGLIGIGTELDPATTKSDSLIGHIAGPPGTLPTLLHEIDLDVHLLDKVIGAEEPIDVEPLKHNERLLLVVGTMRTAGVVTKILKHIVHINLSIPICADKRSLISISRVIKKRFRLIGYGYIK